MSWFTDVRDFHQKFDCATQETPGIPSELVKQLRRDLIEEEWVETLHAMERNDFEGIADGCADLIWVVIGLALAYGIDLRPVWDEVQAANMRKEGGAKREDLKILKPEDWIPPDIRKALADGNVMGDD